MQHGSTMSARPQPPIRTSSVRCTSGGVPSWERAGVAERAPGEQREAVAGGDEREQPGHVGAVVAQRRAEAVGARDRGQLVQRGAHDGRVDPARVDEVLEPDGPAEQRMVGGDGDRERLLPDRGHEQPDLGQPQRVVDRGDAVDEALVELARRDRARHRHAVGDPHRVRSRGDHVRRGEGRRQRRRPDPQRPLGPADDAGDVGAGGIEPQQDRLGVLEQPLAGARRLDRPARQQRRAEVGLEDRDVLRDRRLRVAELRRRAREGADPGDGHERPEEARVHQDLLSNGHGRSLDVNLADQDHELT